MNYFYVIHWPSQRKVFQGDWETVTEFIDKNNVVPGPALVENHELALKPATKKGKNENLYRR